jgi:excinuclease ABC subunit B
MQTAGRTARNVNGRVIMYADIITQSMRKTIDETNRRRKLQTDYNKTHNITPKTIFKSVDEIMNSTSIADMRKKDTDESSFTFTKVAEPVIKYMSNEQKQDLVDQLTEEMLTAAKDLEFERAAALRDEIDKLKKMMTGH